MLREISKCQVANIDEETILHIHNNKYAIETFCELLKDIGTPFVLYLTTEVSLALAVRSVHKNSAT